jgi:peptide/nickel transport system ATP-binding protein
MMEAGRPPPLLEIRSLGKAFVSGSLLRPVRISVLREVSLSLQRAEIVALVGESGSGKSTLGRVIARLLKPDTGKLLLDGEDVLGAASAEARRAFRRRVQMVFQDPFGSLNPAHTIGYHIARPLVCFGITPRRAVEQRVHTLLASVGLEPAERFAAQRPGELSGGQRQRVAVARALAAEPDVLVADEPTSMLDVSLRAGVLNLLSSLRRERGMSIVFITHDLASARYLADRILVMHAGTIVEEGPSEEIVQRPAHPYTRLLVTSVPSRLSPPERQVDPATEPRRRVSSRLFDVETPAG